ncbi:MAG: class I SAM-dependent methyltransferase [Patescibacteria group bacterium]|jgi:2-polyprenyl-3-methyl-5-hydroxy-6-metoxy-1,4-benzoquinol methylase
MNKIINFIKKIFIYTPYDAESYWRSRANNNGNRAVMWKNDIYNYFVSEIEKEKINQYLKNLEGKRILDLGCGVGRISEYLAKKGALVTGIDLEEMIKKARKENNHPNIEYIIGSMYEKEFPENTFDYILSIGSISACCNTKQKLQKIIFICHKSLKENGLMLCMDPFHKWSFLARPARFSINEVIKIARENKFKLVKKNGILFWPIRFFLTIGRAPKSKKINKYLFQMGEKILHISPIFLSDYKILIFKK